MRLTHIIVLALLLGSAPLWSDVVHLKDGKTVEGRTEDLGDYVKVTTVSGSSVKFPKSMIVKIEEKQDPRQAYLERLAKLKPGEAEGHFRLALWCQEHDLDEEYGEMLQKTLRIDPNHAEAKKRLYEYHKFERDLPVNEPACKRLQAEFGPDFEIHRTAHYRICYNCDDVFLRKRASLFEKAYQRFYRYFEEKGYTLAVIPDRLEAVLLDSREDFADYLQVGQMRVPRPAGSYIPRQFVMSAGLYSYGMNRIIFYNALNDAKYKEMRKQAYAIPSSRLTPESRKRLREYKRRLSLQDKVDQNISVTVHEATHQLTFNLKLLNGRADNPMWVVEGIAMYFEAATEGQWYGAGRLNRDRLEVYRKTKLLPSLQTLLVNDRAFQSGNQNSIAAYYAAGWALTYYLLEERPQEFVKYLRFLGEKPSRGPTRPADRLKDFASIFGADLDRIAAEWAAYMSKLK